MLTIRTVFIPKKNKSQLPLDFRPLGIASVIVRQLHKVLANRLVQAGLIKETQRCFEDGCAENITILVTVIDDARKNIKQLHLLSTNVARAFPSPSHHAIPYALTKLGLPGEFVQYIERTNSTSQTVIELKGKTSHPIFVRKGVLQGDPLSMWIFSAVEDLVVSEIPVYIGYEIDDSRIN